MSSENPSGPRPPQTPQTPEPPQFERAYEQSGRDGVQDLGPTTIFTRPIALTETALDDDLVVTDLLTDRSFSLNSTAVAIWRELGSGRTPADVAARLGAAWPCEHDEALEIVAKFARELFLSGLIHSADETIRIDHREDTSQEEQTCR